jgi:hypothetical protein
MNASSPATGEWSRMPTIMTSSHAAAAAIIRMDGQRVARLSGAASMVEEAASIDIAPELRDFPDPASAALIAEKRG